MGPRQRAVRLRPEQGGRMAGAMAPAGHKLEVDYDGAPLVVRPSGVVVMPSAFESPMDFLAEMVRKGMGVLAADVYACAFALAGYRLVGSVTAPAFGIQTRDGEAIADLTVVEMLSCIDGGVISRAHIREAVRDAMHVVAAFLHRNGRTLTRWPAALPPNPELPMPPVASAEYRSKLKVMWDLAPGGAAADYTVAQLVKVDGPGIKMGPMKAVGNFKMQEPWLDGRINGLKGAFEANAIPPALLENKPSNRTIVNTSRELFEGMLKKQMECLGGTAPQITGLKHDELDDGSVSFKSLAVGARFVLDNDPGSTKSCRETRRKVSATSYVNEDSRPDDVIEADKVGLDRVFALPPSSFISSHDRNHAKLVRDIECSKPDDPRVLAGVKHFPQLGGFANVKTKQLFGQLVGMQITHVNGKPLAVGPKTKVFQAFCLGLFVDNLNFPKALCYAEKWGYMLCTPSMIEIDAPAPVCEPEPETPNVYTARDLYVGRRLRYKDLPELSAARGRDVVALDRVLTVEVINNEVLLTGRSGHSALASQVDVIDDMFVDLPIGSCFRFERGSTLLVKRDEHTYSEKWDIEGDKAPQVCPHGSKVFIEACTSCGNLNDPSCCLPF